MIKLLHLMMHFVMVYITVPANAIIYQRNIEGTYTVHMKIRYVYTSMYSTASIITSF